MISHEPREEVPIPICGAIRYRTDAANCIYQRHGSRARLRCSQLASWTVCVFLLCVTPVAVASDRDDPIQSRMAAFEEYCWFVRCSNRLDKVVVNIKESTTASTPVSYDSRKTLLSAVCATEDVCRKVHSALHTSVSSLPSSSRLSGSIESYGDITIHAGGRTLRLLMQDQFVVDGTTPRKLGDSAFVNKHLMLNVSDILRGAKSDLTTTQKNDLSGMSALKAEREFYADDEFAKSDLIHRKLEPAFSNKSSYSMIALLPSRAADFVDIKLPVSLPERYQVEKAQWQQLLDIRGETVESIIVRVSGPQSVFGANQESKWIEIEAKDPITLARVQRGLKGLRANPLLIVPEPSGRGGPGVSPCGEIEIRGNKSRVVMALRARFCLYHGAEECTSWTLARVVHELIAKATGAGLSRHDFKIASGEFDAQWD